MRKLLTTAMIVLTLLMASTATAGSQKEILFTTPTGVQCDIWKVGTDNEVECALPRKSGLTRTIIHLQVTGKPHVNYMTWQMHPTAKLGYGHYITVGNIICRDTRAKFFCDSMKTLHGFVITAKSYRLY